MKRRLLSIVLMLCMVLPLVTVEARADEPYSNASGVISYLDANGVLTIQIQEGCSNFIDFGSGNKPWDGVSKIKKVIFTDGIENIPESAFNGCENLESVTIGCYLYRTRCF